MPRDDVAEVGHEHGLRLGGVPGLAADAQREVVPEEARAEDGVAAGVALEAQRGGDVVAHLPGGCRGERRARHRRERLPEGGDLAVVRPARTAPLW